MHPQASPNKYMNELRETSMPPPSGKFVLGPETPPVGRIRNLYISNILVKIPKNQSLDKTKSFINGIMRSLNSLKEFSAVKITIDVDNY